MAIGAVVELVGEPLFKTFREKWQWRRDPPLPDEIVPGLDYACTVVRWRWERLLPGGDAAGPVGSQRIWTGGTNRRWLKDGLSGSSGPRHTRLLRSTASSLSHTTYPTNSRAGGQLAEWLPGVNGGRDYPNRKGGRLAIVKMRQLREEVEAVDLHAPASQIMMSDELRRLYAAERLAR